MQSTLSEQRCWDRAVFDSDFSDPLLPDTPIYEDLKFNEIFNVEVLYQYANLSLLPVPGGTSPTRWWRRLFGIA